MAATGNKFRFSPFDLKDAAHHLSAAEIWNNACGPALSITPNFIRYNTQQVSGVDQQGQLAWLDGAPVGFILASYEMGNPSPLLSSLINQGWIDAVAVLPGQQKKGLGSELINWAQTWLVSKGCKLIHLGGSMHPFAPGLPVELAAHNIFIKSGFKQTGTTWDVAQDLKDYQPAVNPGLGQVRPLQPDQVEAMRLFLRHEFPDRWMFEFEESLRMGEGLTDFQVLWIDHAIQGMVNLTFENSHRPLDRFYMAGLPRPWGQLGTVGVSHALRGQGFGALIMDSGLRRLKDSGVRGCVIDWTGLLDFYAKFGFKPFREYLILVKDFHL